MLVSPIKHHFNYYAKEISAVRILKCNNEIFPKANPTIKAWYVVECNIPWKYTSSNKIFLILFIFNMHWSQSN